MAMQSFRGAGGIGAVCVRSAVVRTAVIRHGLAELDQPSRSERQLHAALKHASTITAVLATALVAVWWLAA